MDPVHLAHHGVVLEVPPDEHALWDKLRLRLGVLENRQQFSLYVGSRCSSLHRFADSELLDGGLVDPWQLTGTVLVSPQERLAFSPEGLLLAE